MPVAEKSLANLRPAWSTETAPGNGGAWPSWRRALRAQIGEGEELFGALVKLARGEAFAVLAPDGRPLLDPDGRPVILVPSSAVVLGAIRELLDRAFGKPETVDERDLEPRDDAAMAQRCVAAASREDQAALREIAKRLMLGASEPNGGVEP